MQADFEMKSVISEHEPFCKLLVLWSSGFILTRCGQALKPPAKDAENTFDPKASVRCAAGPGAS